MANLALYSSFNMLAIDEWNWTVDSSSSSQLTIFGGENKQIFRGSFSYKGNDVFGVVTSTEYFYRSNKVFSITGMTSIDAHQIQNYAETTGNAQETNAYIFRGNDAMRGSGSADTLLGYEGNDTLDGAAGDDLLSGGAGVDYLIGGLGNDTLDGGADWDIANYERETSAVTVSLRSGKATGTTIGEDTLISIQGVIGSTEGDILTGSDDASLVESLQGNRGADTIDGGAGFDWAEYSVSPSAGVTVNLADGTATDGWGTVDKLANIEGVIGSNYGDTLTGSGSVDEFQGLAGNDTIDGGAESDWVDYFRTKANTGVIVNLMTGTASDGWGGKDKLISIENACGSYYNDNITGNGEANSLKGQAGNDTLSGLDGNDNLYGGDGNDSMVGGAGNDWLNGGNGNDILLGGSGRDGFFGGAGNDTIDGGIYTDRVNNSDLNYVDYEFSSGGVNVNLSGVSGTGNTGFGVATDGMGGKDKLINISQVIGSDYADVLIGSSALVFEEFLGGKGDDTIDGGLITDTLNGQNNNRVFYEHASGAVTVNLATHEASGADGNDKLYNINSVVASDYSDKITGSDLGDQLEGRAGNDTIDGAGGSDSTVYYNAKAAMYVNLADGVARSLVEENDAGSGTDSLISVEGVAGSNFGDSLVGGNAASDALEYFQGGGGNDTIDGGSGYDRVDYTWARAGVEVNLGGYVNGRAVGGEKVDTDTLISIEAVRGSAFGDTLTGSSDDIFESFEGREGNDTINGMGGIDRVVYHASKSGVTVNLTTGNALDGYDGIDTLSNIEDVLGSRDFNDSITGSNEANKLEGQGGNDTLLGLGGDDTLNAGTVAAKGVDVVDGGAGSDTLVLLRAFADYTISRPNTTDVLLTNALTQETIKVRNVESFIFRDGTKTLSEALGNVVSKNDDIWVGTSGPEAKDGGAGNDTLVGLAGNDSLIGGAGNDRLDGGTGDDTLTGGLGDDVYVIDSTSDKVIEAVNGGTDRVETALANYTLADNVENLSYTGAIDFIGTGQSLNNLLIGGAGTDSLAGLDGNDTLDGGIGVDTLTGGAGNDTYYVDETGEVVSEGELKGGTDLVISSAAYYALAENIENLTLAGISNDNVGVGNKQANVLTGNGGDNLLEGKGGADTLIGGVGDDEYVVNLKAVGSGSKITVALEDTIKEVAGAKGGNDTLWLDLGDKIVPTAVTTLTLATDLENLNASHSDDVLLNLTGNTSDNILTGNDAANIIEGKGGDDELNGGTGNDTLIGGSGTDLLKGGAGNDTYVVNLKTVAIGPALTVGLEDVISEVNGEGVDTLKLSGTTTAWWHLDLNTLAANLENLDASATASSRLDLTGNNSANILTGNAVANIIDGAYGNDTLDGGAGADTMVGGDGDDVFVFDNLGDKAVEVNGTGSGTDLIQIKIAAAGKAYKLDENVENGVLLNTVAFNLTGNGLENVLTGNAAANILDGGSGDDRLIGGLGKDTLIGGDGTDTFVFNTALNKLTNIDAIKDFATGVDKIELSASIFKELTVGAGVDLAGTNLGYDSTTGVLSYDADGKDFGAAAVTFATLGAGTKLSGNDLIIVS